jgi:gentisate 1,2-dioxygenase
MMSPYDELTFRVTPRGARSAFLIDPSLGYRTSGLTAVMHQLAPGLHQSRHRHGGEAWLYVVTGHGHSDIDGESYPWEAGDLVVVDHWAWHQHFNDDPDNVSSLIRVHSFHTLYAAMQALLDPLELFEEPPKLDAPEIKNVEWPEFDANRPPG